MDKSVILPEFVVQGFATGFFNRGKIFLDLAEEFGTPLYVVEPAVLRDRADRFRSAFSRHLPDARFYYAMKSNNLPYISGVMLTQGFGLDVSSGSELSCALDLGADDIVFSGPGKTDAELMLAAEHSDRVTLLIDSIGEFGRLKPIAATRKNKTLKIGIRINTNPEGLWRKFGIMPDALPSLIRDINAAAGVAFTGVQFHSSWNLDPVRQVECIRSIGQLLSALPGEMLDQCEFIDIGGGYWPPQGEWMVTDLPLVHRYHPAVCIEQFAEEIAAALKQWVFPVKTCRVCFEPGRWICNDAMHILMRVVDKKEDDMVITDGGTNAVGWERFETDYFPVLNLSCPSFVERPCLILGALCTPHDVWGYAFCGEDIREKDVLMIPTQGAYTYSLRQEFIKPLPRVAALEGKGRLLSSV